MPEPSADRSHTFIRDVYLSVVPPTIYSSGSWWRFNKRHWEPLLDDLVKREIQQVVDKKKLLRKPTSGTLASVTELIRVEKSRPDDYFDRDTDLIAFQDCVLRVSTDERLPHEPEQRLTSCFPFDHDPSARSDAWEKFLSEVVQPEHLPFLQEYAGYCLTTDTSHELALWLHSKPGGGKSTFIEGLKAAFGKRVVTLGMSDIENSRFGLTHLPGKTLAVSTEQPAFLKSVHIVIQLISGEALVVDRKYRDPYEVIPHVKLLWAMNELPQIPKHGQGLERRILVMEFIQIDRERLNPLVKEEIKKSGQAIFNWMFLGLKRFKARGNFEVPDGLKPVSETASEIEVDVEDTLSELTCVECEKTFNSNSPNKKFCSNPCRLRHWRRNHAA